MARALAVLALFGLLGWYVADVGPGFVLTSGDDFAYASSTADLAEGASLVHRFASPALATQFNPVDRQPGAYASKYPLGVSFLLVPIYRLGGYPALFVFGPLMAVLAVIALYLLALEVTGRRPIALLAAALLATLPSVGAAASVIGSDLPATTFLVAALAVYVRHRQRPRPATFYLFALLAGASFLVRNPNGLLFAIVFAHALLVDRRRWRAELWTWIGGAVLFAALVAVQVGINHAVFGSWFGGYAHEAGEGGFALRFLPHHLPRYLLMLCALPPLGLVATVLMAVRHRREQQGIITLLATILLAFTLLYATWWSAEFDPGRGFVGGLRFLIVILPIACLFVALAHGLIAAARWRRVVVAVVLAAQIAGSLVLTVELRRYKGRMAAHRDRIDAVTARDALLLGPRDWSKLFFSRDGTGRERRYAAFESRATAADLVDVVDASLASGRPVYLLGSGSRRSAKEAAAFAAIRARHRLQIVGAATEPYELEVDEVL